MTEACDLADQLAENTKNAAYAFAIWAFYHPAEDPVEYERILVRLATAETICQKLGEESDVAFIAENSARLLLSGPLKDAEKARLQASTAVKIREKLENLGKLGRARLLLAQCLDSQASPDWEEAAKVYREALSCLTADEDKASRATALYYLAQCLHSQATPDWEEAYQSSEQALKLWLELERKTEAVQVLAQLAWLCPRRALPPWVETINLCRTTLRLLTEDEDKAMRATALNNLAQCLYSQATPDWEEAYQSSEQALKLWLELERKTEAVQLLAQLVWLCPRRALPPWVEATELCRAVLGILTADEDKRLRGTAVHCLSSILQASPTPDWSQVISISEQAVELLMSFGEANELEQALIGLASALHDQPTPDMTRAIALWKEICHRFPNVNSLLGLIMSLDRAGEFVEADRWVSQIQPEQLGGDDESPDTPLAQRREAYLALRRNDLDSVTAVALRLENTSENARGMLLISLVRFVQDEPAQARQYFEAAQAASDDMTWFWPIADAYYTRHRQGNIDKYKQFLGEA